MDVYTCVYYMGVTPLARTLVSKKLVQIILVSLPETISKFQVDSSIFSPFTLKSN